MASSTEALSSTSNGRATIASGHPLVTSVARQLLQEGGNAFDAVVGAGFTSALAEPALTSLGGGGFCLARQADGQATVFDFFCNSPGVGGTSSTQAHFEEIAIHFPGAIQHFHIGRASIAVPGLIKGLLHMHDRLGRLPLDVVLGPAIAQHAEGIELNAYQARLLSLLEPILLFTPESRALYAPHGHLLQAGERIRSPETADLLRALVDDGAAAFYEGALAQAMSDDCVAGHGLLTVQDLQQYDVIERAPHRCAYRDRTVLTNPAPSLGGPLIGLGLHLLEQLPQEVLQRDGFLGQAHMRALLSTMRGTDQLRAQGILCVDDFESQGPDVDVPTHFFGHHIFTRGTTHMSIADADGNVASMTTSNGEGSGVMVPGTGIMLNNMMGEDDLHPDGFHQGDAGVRVASMMSPTVVLDDDGRCEMVLGSGGSKRIRTAILQVLTHVVDHGVSLDDAVQAARVHWDGETAQIEPGFADDVVVALQKDAHCNVWRDRDVYFGGVHALQPNNAASGDPRRGGDAVVGTGDASTR